jgi:hypothetical protein
VQQFDHRKAGYRLEGRHSELSCRKCHKSENISSAAKKELIAKDLNGTYLGLSQDCASCHRDAHQGELSADCIRCHNYQTWKGAGWFDHKEARFRLEGAHVKVECRKCHPLAASQTVAKFKGSSFSDCAPCHRDPHSGAFKSSCRSCHHSQASWKSHNAPATFKHSTTKFPLEGKHATISCSACHIGNDFAKAISFTNCADCHKKDPHRGQFASDGVRADCSACHTVHGFKPSTFRTERHAETAFPLRGTHQTTNCDKCHSPNPAGVVYKIADFSCAACHRDIHAGQFKAAPFSNRCEACHTEEKFQPSSYTIAQHEKARFALTGAHLKTECAKCHDPSAKPVRFRFDDSACTACHQDPHRGEFSLRMASKLADGTVDGCRACHTTDSWRDLNKFDHATTSFLLEGAHRELSCDRCHKMSPLAGANKAVNYKAASKECAACHEDPHAGQFAARMAMQSRDGKLEGCGICHSVKTWHDMDRFDHASMKFALTGVHQTTECAKCHQSSVSVRLLVYREASQECAGCHRDIHEGQFASAAQKTDCSRCHQTGKWSPSTFDHDTQSIFKLTGAHRNVRCDQCHAKTKGRSGENIVAFKNVPAECSDCHGSETKRH